MELGHVGALQVLIAAGDCVNGRLNQQDLDISWESTSEHTMPVHNAVVGGHIEDIRVLVDADNDVHAENCHGQTPVHLSVNIGGVETMQVLVTAVVSLDSDSYDMMPAHLVAQRGHVEFLRTIITASINVEGRDNAGNMSFHSAGIIEEGYSFVGDIMTLSCAKVLLGAGAQVDAQNYACCTLLHGTDKELVEVLLGPG